MIQVVQHLDPHQRQAIGAFLGAFHAGGEHDPRWLDVLKFGLGHRPYVLLAHESDSASPLVGYLPLALVSSRLFGRFLVSLPYLNRAGAVAKDANVANALIDEAVKLADQLDVQYLELRHGDALDHAKLPQRRDEKVRMVLDLPDSRDALWSQIPSKVRNQIRKGDKHDLSARFGGLELLDDFYQIFARNMRDLGTPVYGRRFFSQLLTSFDDRAELVVTDYQNQAVAAALLIHDPDQTQVPSASALREFNATNANMWMYHQLLGRAIDRGSKAFDFGRSSEDSGTYRFKKQWGAQPVPTVWQYHLRRGDIHQMRPDSPRYRRRIATWQKLPVWVTTLIGPSIVRGIP